MTRSVDRPEIYQWHGLNRPNTTLRHYLDERVRGIPAAVAKIPDEDFERDDLHHEHIADIEDLLRLEPIELGASAMDEKVTKETITSTDPRRMGPGRRPKPFKVDAYTLQIPYSGDSDLMRYWPPDAKAHEPPPGTSLDPRTHVIQVKGRADPYDRGGASLNRHLTDADALIRKLVNATNRAVETWNTSLPERIEKAIDVRRRALGKRDEIRGALPFPTGAAQPKAIPYRLPRPARPRRPAPPTLEHGDYPLLTEEDLAEVVAVIRRWATFVAEHPTVAKDKNEEALRDELLHDLNTKWEATGETFSKNGKTDIRVQISTAVDTGVSDSVFKGECKIWDDAGSVSDAFIQLTDRYLTNREHRAAIILFVRDAKQLPTVRERAVKRLVEHHGGEPASEIAGWPVVNAPHPQHSDRMFKTVIAIIDVSQP